MNQNHGQHMISDPVYAWIELHYDKLIQHTSMDGPLHELINTFTKAAEAERDSERKERESLYPILDEKSRLIKLAEAQRDELAQRLATMTAEFDKAVDSIGYHQNAYLSRQTEIDNLQRELTDARAAVSSMAALAKSNGEMLALADREYKREADTVLEQAATIRTLTNRLDAMAKIPATYQFERTAPLDWREDAAG